VLGTEPLGILEEQRVLLTVEPSVHQEALKLIRHVGPEGDRKVTGRPTESTNLDP
jgi:hydrogenase maturation factor